MNEKKLNELLNKALNSLTEEQKEKAKACKTTKELLDYLSAEGVELSDEAGAELPDEALDMVAGGVSDIIADVAENAGAAGKAGVAGKAGKVSNTVIK